MKNILSLLCLFLIGCSNNITSSIEGTWYFSSELYQREIKTINEPQIDLSENYKIIKMVFEENGNFTSYLDKQITKGKWEVKDSLLHMIPYEKKRGIYEFKYVDNELSGRWWLGLYSPQSDEVVNRKTSKKYKI